MGKCSILGAGSVLAPGRSVPNYEMWAGNPAKFVRDVSKDEVTTTPLKLSRKLEQRERERERERE
jgi:carbonic anhydrase/acetyltransferase-like protein (isoleucine patch superfamily)